MLTKTRRSPVTKGLKKFLVDVVKRKSLDYQTGEAGGFLLPPALKLGVDTFLKENGLFFQYGIQLEMTSGTLEVPNIDLSASHATGESPLFGGMDFQWVDQNVTPTTDSEPNFSTSLLVAKTVMGTIPVSNQMIQDGGEALAQYLEAAFQGCLEFTCERAFLRGTGIKEPLGVLNSPACTTVARAGGGAIALADLNNMQAALLPACYPYAFWLCSPAAYAKISLIAGRINHGGDGLWLHGRPLIITEKLVALGTRGDVMLVTPAMYCTGSRNIEIAASQDDPTVFTKNRTMYRIIWRGDGKPLPGGTFTTADGKTSMGCFVALGDP